MIDFNDKEALKKIDPQDTTASTDMLVQQLRASWEEVAKIDVHGDYSGIVNIIFCGMGASIYGALVLKALEGRDMPPLELISDYHLPNYVSENTLVVLTSYSGTTEEVLSCAEEAVEKKAKILILTKGGPLAEFANSHKITAYVFDGKYNPAGVPRLGNGYTIMGIIGLFNKVKIIDIEEREIEDALTRLAERSEELKNQAEADFTK